MNEHLSMRLNFYLQKVHTGPAQPIGQVGHLPYHFFPRLR